MSDYITSWPVWRDGEGRQFIGCTYVEHACGCKITGGGTLQQPLTIQYCPTHARVDALQAACKAALQFQYDSGVAGGEISDDLTGKLESALAVPVTVTPPQIELDEDFVQQQFADAVNALRPEWEAARWHTGGGIWCVGITLPTPVATETGTLDFQAFGPTPDYDEDISWMLCVQGEITDELGHEDWLQYDLDRMGCDFILARGDGLNVEAAAQTFVQRVEDIYAKWPTIERITY